MVTGASKESRVVSESISAFTSKTTEPILFNDDGFPIDASTVVLSSALIWITTEVEVDVKPLGVVTVIVEPLSERVELAAEFTLTTFEVVDVGTVPAVHPVVVKFNVSEVELFADIPTETTL